MMSEKLVAGLGEGLEIETNSESAILLNFIRDNWDLDGLAASKVGFGSYPDRTKLPVTLRTYRIYSNIRDADVGSKTYRFDVPVAIDIYVRDVTASAQRREPNVLISIETYLRQFISTNRLGLRDKGINNIQLVTAEYLNEPVSSTKDEVYYHLVMTVRMYYHMQRVPI